MSRHLRYLCGLVLASSLTLLAACGDCLFLYPLASGQNGVTEKAIEGVWTLENPADDFHVVINGQADGSYVLETGHGPKTESRYKAQLVKAGDAHYLDLYPVAADGLDEPTLFGRGFIGFHRIYQIEQIEPVLIARELDGGWLKRVLEFEPDAIRHEHIAPEGGGTYHLVLAKQAQLESFVARHSVSDRRYWATQKGQGELRMVRADPGSLR